MSGDATLSRNEWTATQAVAFQSRRSPLAAAYLLLSLAGLIGLSIGNVPFAVDLPNHAARLFVECSLGDPTLSRMYSVEYGLIPNLAIDVLNRPLCGVVDPLTVARGSMVLAQAGVLLIVWKLQRFLYGEPSAFVLLAPAMTFNVITSVGYLNYLIGTFLFLAFAWSMLRYRMLERQTWVAIVLSNVAGILLFFCHVFVLALAVVFLFGLRFGVGTGQALIKRFASAGAMTIVSFAIPLLMVLLVERSSTEFDYEAIRKFRSIFAPLLYSDAQLAFALSCIWIAFVCVAFQQKRVSLAPPLRWALAFLAIYALLLPSALSDAVDLDSRSFVSTGYLAIAALGMSRPAGDRDIVAGILQVSAAFLAIMTVALQLWFALPMMKHLERDALELRRALRVIAPGRALVSMENAARAPALPKIFYLHLASYATLDRKAFNPLEFTGKGMQPLVARQRYGCIDAPVGAPLSTNAARRLSTPEAAGLLEQSDYRRYRYGYLWPERFDYVLYYHFGAADNPFPAILRPVHNGTFFTIFRTSKPINQDGPCDPQSATPLAG